MSKSEEAFLKKIVFGEQKTEPFRPLPRISVEDSLNIYQNNYESRLTASLSDTYEAIYRFLTPEIFKKVALAYIKTHPCRQSQLQSYGKHFSEHLSSQVLLESFPFLVELAELEWKIKEILFLPGEARGFPSLSKKTLVSDLTELTDDAILQCPSSGQVGAWNHPVDGLYADLMELGMEQGPLKQEPFRLYIFKQGRGFGFFRISPREEEALTQLQRGASAKELLQTFQGDSSLLAQFLSQFYSKGLLFAESES